MEAIHPFIQGFLIVKSFGQFCTVGEGFGNLAFHLLADLEDFFSNAAPFSLDGRVLVATAACELAVERIDDFEGVIEENLLCDAHL